MKSVALKDTGSVNIAIKLLLSKELNTNFSFFNEGVTKPQTIILDVYSAIYLAISGLYVGVNHAGVKMVLTHETKNQLQNWITSIFSEHMKIGSYEGGLLPITRDQIINANRELTDALKNILSLSNVVSLECGDIPLDLMNLRSFIDSSVYSSMQLSNLNSISWLCLDPNICSIQKQMGFTVVNCQEFFQEITSKTPLNFRVSALKYHFTNGFICSFPCKDILELSRSGNNELLFLCSEIIDKFHGQFKPPINVFMLTSTIVVNAAVNAFKNGACNEGFSLKKSTIFKFVDKLVYSCLSSVVYCKNGKLAEENVIEFLLEVYRIVDNSHVFELICVYVERFIRGHFLDLEYIKENFNSVIQNI